MFKKALPVFPIGLKDLMNVSVVFVCTLPARSELCELRITGATRYRVYLGEELLIYGPARAAQNYARVDALPLELLRGGQLRIELSSYNCRSFDGVNHSGFLLAEVECCGEILAATGYDFDAYINKSRLRRVMRFSYQRHFSEVYNGIGELEGCELETLPLDLQLLPREVPMPCMQILPPTQTAACGTFTMGKRTPVDFRFVSGVPEHSDGYPADELKATPYLDYAALHFSGIRTPKPFAATMLKAGEYEMIDFGRAHTGFMRADVDVFEDTYLIISYEEYCPDAYVPTNRLGGQYIHMVAYTLKAGHYDL